MASSYVPRIDQPQPRSGRLLRFTAVRDLQAAAMARATTLAPVSGLRLTVSVSLPDIAPQREVIAGLRRVGQNVAARVVDDARRLSTPTYETGLFKSAWKAPVEVTADGRIIIDLQNPAPYAGYVHRAGERAKGTVVDLYIRPAVAKRRRELVEDVATLINRFIQRGRK